MSIAVGILALSVLTTAVTNSESCLRAPVSAPISATFVQPACRYCSGHRTVDFAAPSGAQVIAPISGTVTFAGVVAGKHYITLDPGGRSTGVGDDFLVTLGGVIADPWAIVGAHATAGGRIGSVVTSPVRLSLRRVIAGGPAEYLDPEPSLMGWRGPVRLVPDPSLGRDRARDVRRIWSCRRPI